MKNGFFKGLASRSWLPAIAAAALSLAAGGAVQGEPRVRVTPYLEVQSVITADFSGGEVLTYAAVGGGADVSVKTRRVQTSASFNLLHRVGISGDLIDTDIPGGVAAFRYEAIPGTLAIDAGAMAARTHSDPRLPVPSISTVDDPRVSEVYGFYAGPTLTTQAGPTRVAASYRLGYVHVDDQELAGSGLPPAAARRDRFRSSVVHNAAVSVGMAPGELPVGWTASAGYTREDQSRLKTNFEAKHVRGEVLVPVSPSLALTGGVGYEEIDASHQDVVRDADGRPVFSPRGNLIADPTKPRLHTYEQSDVFWDAGVIWRPSPRTELTARGGWRYGGTTFVGSLEHRFSRHSALSAAVYDSVTSFGHLIVHDLSGLPRNFTIPRGGFDTSRCVFGADPGTGACFSDDLAAISSLSFRNRGGNIFYSSNRGPWSLGAGAAYSNRRYLAASGDPAFPLAGLTDESVTLTGVVGRRFTRSSGFDATAYAAWYDSGLADGSFGAGLTGRYYRPLINERIQATAQAGLYTTDGEGFDATYGSILFGLRYSF